MPLPIHVDAHSGFKANGQFVLDEEVYPIEAVEDQWYSPDAMFSRVRTPAGKRYILRYDERADAWTLQSDFDGAELFARPGIALIPVDYAAIREAERRVVACERCHPHDAEIPFDWILAEVLDKHGMYEFILTEEAGCPICGQTPP